MNVNERLALRAFVENLLREHDDELPVEASDSLFASGRLDSLGAVELVEFLEQTFGVDFSKLEFSIDRVDSLRAVEAFVRSARQ